MPQNTERKTRYDQQDMELPLFTVNKIVKPPQYTKYSSCKNETWQRWDSNKKRLPIGHFRYIKIQLDSEA